MENKDIESSFVNPKYSTFSIEPNDLQIAFNYFYFLGYGLHQIEETIDIKHSREEKIKKSIPAYEKRDWNNSEAAHYMRNELLSDLLIDHFHIKPSEIFDQEQTKFTVTNSLDEDYQFEISSAYYDHGCDLDSIAPIECSILKNGHLILTIKVMYKGRKTEKQETSVRNDIPAYSVIDLIKKPELIRSNNKKTGGLVKKMEEIARKIEPKLDEILKLKELKRNRIDIEKEDNLESLPIIGYAAKEEKSSRSRPYIGVLFRVSKATYGGGENLMPSIRKFVIAAARTTPVFSTMFIDEEDYLSTRDIYLPGRSIVYIARRGWCIYDSQEQDREAFMLGAVESTHTVVTTCFATARSWRMFISTCRKDGRVIFQKLNNAINRYFLNPIGESARLSFIAELGRATLFLASIRAASPEKGLSRLIEAHVMSHTARGAVQRCEELTHLRELEKVSEERISEYLNLMGIAEDYLRIKTVDYSDKNLKIANLVLYVAVITLIITLLVNVADLIRSL